MARQEHSRREEWANAITHGVGAGLSFAGLLVLVGAAAWHRDPWLIVSVSIYGASLVALYATSTVYHAVRQEAVKRVLEHLDHAAIFLLIAGTYTPFTLVNMRGPVGYWLFGIVWSLAALGILYKIFSRHRFSNASVLLYLAMGWLIVGALGKLMATTGTGGLWLLFSGGLAYSAGVIFYVWRRLPFNHAIWHLFVVSGSVLHYCAVLFYVVPKA